MKVQSSKPYRFNANTAWPSRLFIPVGDDMQYIWIIDKKEDGTVVREKSFGVRYVSLTDAPKE